MGQTRLPAASLRTRSLVLRQDGGGRQRGRRVDPPPDRRAPPGPSGPRKEEESREWFRVFPQSSLCAWFVSR